MLFCKFGLLLLLPQTFLLLDLNTASTASRPTLSTVTVASRERRVLPGHFVGVHVPEVELALTTSREKRLRRCHKAETAPHVGLEPESRPRVAMLVAVRSEAATQPGGSGGPGGAAVGEGRGSGGGGRGSVGGNPPATEDPAACSNSSSSLSQI